MPTHLPRAGRREVGSEAFPVGPGSRHRRLAGRLRRGGHSGLPRRHVREGLQTQKERQHRAHLHEGVLGQLGFRA